MTTLIDLIFRGSFSIIDFSFMKRLILQSREMNFNFPENISEITFEEIIKVFNSNNYVDFVISINCMSVDEIVIHDVFINIGREDENIEMLLFFDLKNLNNNFQEGLDYLYHWSTSFKNKYCFEGFTCQTDGVNSENEFYFESN